MISKSKTIPALALLTVTGFAQAQLEEVVVTAQKREASLQETPIAITAFTEESLEQIGAFNPTDIAEYVPNVTIVKTFGSAGNINARIRGISTGEPSLAIDPKVGMYIDGVYIARNAGAVFDIVDIERVEILRGPQGTLWGKNTTGGAISIITKKPLGEWAFKQSFTVGSYGEFRSTTSLDTTTVAGLSAKLSYMMKDYDGWATNTNPAGEQDLGSLDTDAYRVALRWDASDTFSADYTYDYSDLDAVPMPLQITKVGPGGTDPGVIGTYDLRDGAFNGGYNPLAEMLSVVEPKRRVEKFSLDGNTVESTKVSGHNLTLEWDLGEVQLKSITAYREYESDLPGNDLDGGSWTTDAGEAIPMFHAYNEKEQDQFSQEIQILGTTLNDRLDYVAGLFYFEEEGTEINPWDALFYVPGTPVLLRGLGAAAGSFYDIESQSQAAFGQFKYYLNDEWDVTLGLRYTEDEKEITLLEVDPRFDADHTASDDWSQFTMDVIVGYQLNEDISLYAKRVEGYNAGVFSLGALNHNDYTDFEVFDTPADAEDTVSYELGVKSEWFDHRLRVNAAAFYNDNENLQITAIIEGVRTVSNSGESVIKGGEFDFSAMLTDTIRIDGAYGYVKTEYDDSSRSDGSEKTASMSLIYSKALDIGFLDARFDTTYTGARDFSTSPYGNSESYSLMNARLGISDIEMGGLGSLRIATWVKNIQDEEYKVYGADLGTSQGPGYAGNSFGTPRSIGFDVVYEY